MGYKFRLVLWSLFITQTPLGKVEAHTLKPDCVVSRMISDPVGIELVTSGVTVGSRGSGAKKFAFTGIQHSTRWYDSCLGSASERRNNLRFVVD